MTDFRRPDLDLWDEEDDGEDLRPTIVSERPARPLHPVGLPPLARMSLAQRLIAKGELEATDDLKSTLAAPSAGSMPAAMASTAQAPSRATPMELAAREAADAERASDAAGRRDSLVDAQRDSTEILDDSQLDLLRLSEPGASTETLDRVVAGLETALPLGAPLPQSARRVTNTEPIELRGSGAPLVSEPEALVLTRVARRPRAPQATPRRPPAVTEEPMFRDREVTERISMPPLASSIAPAARTMRPQQRTQKGMGAWQLALVAMLLIGAGLGVARFRRENAAAVQAARLRDEASAPQLSPTPLDAPETASVAELEPAPAEELQPVAALDVAAAPEPAVAMAEPQPPAPTPASTKVVQPRAKPERAALQATRLAKTQSEVAIGERRLPAAEPAAERAPQGADAPFEPARPAAPVARPAGAGQDLPAQPSRNDVRAALDAVVPELRKCTGERHGTADVTLTVRSPGVVSHAVVAGTFAGTPEGSCIARTIKMAQFPPFREQSVRVSYPFQL